MLYEGGSNCSIKSETVSTMIILTESVVKKIPEGSFTIEKEGNLGGLCHRCQ